MYHTINFVNNDIFVERVARGDGLHYAFSAAERDFAPGSHASQLSYIRKPDKQSAIRHTARQIAGWWRKRLIRPTVPVPEFNALTDQHDSPGRGFFDDVG
ncbi:TPA: hypothetical protein ACJ2WV_004485 [Kluyvera georgiana]